MTELLFDGMALTVEVGFSTTAGAGRVPIGGNLTDITWTDITEHVREVSTSRGRSSELDAYPAGSCQVLLDNRTRLFDPENTAGTYYGKLTPLRPIRIRVTPSGGTIRSIFFGFIEQWPQAYSWPNESTVSVTASDAFKVLNEFKLPSYWVYTTTYDAAPSAWYPLRDFLGSFYAFEIGQWTATSAQWMSSAGAGATSFCTPGPSLIVDDPATSSSFDGQRYLQINDRLGTNGALTVFSVEMWIQTTETTTGRYSIWNHGTFINAANIGMVVSGGNATIVGQFGNRSGGSSFYDTKTIPVTVNDGKPHHVALMYSNLFPSGARTYNIWVDGIDTGTTGSVVGDIDNQYSFMTLGYPVTKSSTAGTNFTEYFRGSIAELLVYSEEARTTAEVIAQYKAGTGQARTGERTDQRITYLADLADWMTDGLDLNTGDSTVQGIQVNKKGLLDALKEVETAEQGRLFMSVDGKIRFIDRNAEGSGTFITSQATFSDNPGIGEIKYSDIVLTYDDRYIFNEVTVTQPNGTSYTESDSTSQGKYFKRTLEVDNFIADDGYYTANTAIYKIQQYKDPQMRIDQMTVNPRRAVAYQSPCVTLDIGDRITVERTPQDVGAQIVKTLIVEGVKHSITRDKWVVTFNTAPTLQNAPFVLDSATLGVLDTNILAY
jgi:hypothetical protein